MAFIMTSNENALTGRNITCKLNQLIINHLLRPPEHNIFNRGFAEE